MGLTFLYTRYNLHFLKLKPGGFFIVVLANFRIEGKFYDFVGDTKNILKQNFFDIC